MNHIIHIFALVLAIATLTACAGSDHAFQGNPLGQKSAYLMQKFGYPSETKPSVQGAKTWVYQTGGRSGSWEYTIKNDTIVNCHKPRAPSSLYDVTGQGPYHYPILTGSIHIPHANFKINIAALARPVLLCRVPHARGRCHRGLYLQAG